MCDKNNNNGSCFAATLERIVLLQQAGENSVTTGCDKPFLGNVSLLANTRPINLYCCCTNNIWQMPYDYNGTSGTSSFFRVESVNDNCATFRILIPTDTGYTATNNFFVINLNCIGSIKCLADTLLANV